MWFLISRRFRRWLIIALAVPLGSWLLAKLADRIGDRRGESAMTKALRAPRSLRQRRTAA